MKKVLMAAVAVVCLSGCGGLRFAATEAQRQNAWAHLRTCEVVQQTAKEEAVSAPLAGLTRLATQQSEASVDAQRRPDVWVITDAAMELGVGLAGLLG